MTTNIHVNRNLGKVKNPTFDGQEQEQEEFRSVDWFVNEEVASGRWREEILAPEITGMSRPLKVYRAPRKTNFITHDWHGDKKTFCPPLWWDLAIGSGACGFGCRSCFLMLTHRIKRDPLAHLLYDNTEDFVKATRSWLVDPKRMPQHTLGLGIDRSDSLLFEGVTGHVRNLAPLFGDEKTNPKGVKLVLLTKSANTLYLEQVKPEHRKNIVVTFSLNPQEVADLWEGKYPDGDSSKLPGTPGSVGERITPSIGLRLLAAKTAQSFGYEVRVRLDPILTPDGWEEYYRDFMRQVAAWGIDFRYWTLGTYREKNNQLDAWRERWGLLPMEWQPKPEELVKEGTHYHLSHERRAEIYSTVTRLIRFEFPKARVSLCKETHVVRKQLNLCNADCNCLR